MQLVHLIGACQLPYSIVSPARSTPARRDGRDYGEGAGYHSSSLREKLFQFFGGEVTEAVRHDGGADRRAFLQRGFSTVPRGSL